MPGHSVVHIEIPAIKSTASGKFYHDVFDWKIEADETYNYVQFQPQEGPRGGFIEPSEENPVPYKPDRLLVYISTDDIEASLASIEAHGGKTVLTKTEIPYVGWWAVFTDPAGNHLALFTAAPRG